MSTRTQPVGNLLKSWRQRRRMSQLDLALEANVSTRHLSFVETGRARPSREMVLHLSDRLDVPLRERNLMLTAAGYAPVFRERSLDDPEMFAARLAVELVLSGHEPFPAIAVDRHWTLVAANDAVPALLDGAAPALLKPPVNVLRLSLHPDGLAPRIANLGEWRRHLLERLRRQVETIGDDVLADLLDELTALPAPDEEADAPPGDPHAGVVVPFRLRTATGTLNFFSTVTVFGTPVDITLSELAIEAFFPADPTTGEALRKSLPPR